MLRNGGSEKYVSILRALERQTLGRVRVHEQLSPPFDVSIVNQKGCPISPFNFNFAVEDLFYSVANCHVQRALGPTAAN